MIVEPQMKTFQITFFNFTLFTIETSFIKVCPGWSDIGRLTLQGISQLQLEKNIAYANLTLND